MNTVTNIPMSDYPRLLRLLSKLSEKERVAHLRNLARTDLYFLLRYLLNRPDIEHPWVFQRCREVQQQPNGYLDLWAREHYKALDCDTPIWTPDGWRRHGDLAPGDRVFSPSGKVVTVLANTGEMLGSDCWYVGGVVAGGDHRWPHQAKSKPRCNGRRDPVYTRADVITREASAIRLPLAEPLDGKGNLPIPPYVLGVWLGDGNTSCGRVTSGDHELWGLLNWPVTDSSVSITKNLSGLMPLLRAEGLLHNKHVPDKYLHAPAADRLALLQGLMDTDGSVNSRGTATFVNTNEQLVDAVALIARSMGWPAHKRRYENDKAGYWQVSFQAYTSPPPFRLSRKLAWCKPGDRRMVTVRPERTHSRPVNCIQVEGGMYLAGEELLPTCNSTIITFAKSIQDILASHGDNPLPEWGGREVTLGIFSFNRGKALDFVQQIKVELEDNALLKYLFPDVLYQNPEREARQWSVQGGLTVKRRSNPKESTLEGWGLVDSMPTGAHFVGRVYDDVITERFARSPEMIAKTTESWELSLNLGSRGGFVRYIGTRYNYNDTYRTMMNREAATLRLYPATDNGKMDGEPVLLTPDELKTKRREMGPYVFACHGAGTLVTMEDLTHKPIEEVRAGDRVVGYRQEAGARTQLVVTEVKATSVRDAPLMEYMLASGAVLHCTSDHKWWHGRWRENSYSTLEKLGGVIRLIPDAGYRSGRDALVGGRLIGIRPVYNIQTETGNYIANGYASKNCQMLQDPKADETQGFKPEWLRYYQEPAFAGMNLYLICDPASEKKKDSDWTAMAVIALGPDDNYYLVDMVYDRLNLTERTARLMHMHRKWKPRAVGYEKYGKDSDIEHIEYIQEQENYHFDIIELGGRMPKNDRIRRLIPLFEQGRFYLPQYLPVTQYDGRAADLVETIIREEYDTFPMGTHDDMLDCISRILDEDMYAIFPRTPEYREQRYQSRRRRRSWVTR